jgi:sec-independent protein translocase protein TatA
MGSMSPFHWAIVALVALLVFGPRKLPELARGLGEAMKEFKKTMHPTEEPEAAPSVAERPGVLPETAEPKPGEAPPPGGPPHT